MALKISPTPILKGEEVIAFLLEMDELVSPEKKQMLKRIKAKHEPDLF